MGGQRRRRSIWWWLFLATVELLLVVLLIGMWGFEWFWGILGSEVAPYCLIGLLAAMFVFAVLAYRAGRRPAQDDASGSGRVAHLGPAKVGAERGKDGGQLR